ncbi:hypothetical protein [Cohnella hongkongensis]|uniref:Uncharacterized protein n=1 Tax=Cohnella hongkongensis TaxID=178337 RepID=A0ABV9FLE0_9BACL
MRITAEEALQAIESRPDYSWWERARLRLYGERGAAFGIDASWDSERLEQAAKQAWGNLVREEGTDASRTIEERNKVR